MALLLLIRHGITDATGVRLYGRSPGVHLSSKGREQAARLGRRLADTPLEAVYSSPLERCLETAAELVRGREIRVRRLAGLLEVDYGEWTGRSFAMLRRSAAWRRVHHAPSSVRFPGGETLAEVQARVIRAIEGVWDRHPKGAVALVTHGDVIRLALAHVAGVHLDLFHRFLVEPASLSAIELRDGVPLVVRVNDTGEPPGVRG